MQGLQQAHWPTPMHLLQQLALQEPQQQQQQQQQQQAGRGPPSRDQLGPDQLRAVDAALQGSCIFLTGGAGVGKSFTVAVLVDALQHSGRRVAVTASTGTAAVNVGGSTLHSFAGILDPTKPKVKLAEGMWKWQKFMENWRQVDALLVDEISMVDCETLEKVDYVARYLRGWRLQRPSLPGLQGIAEVHELHPEPFGGLQLIAVGDFFQLSPVQKDNERYIEPGSPQQQQPGSGSSTPGRGSGRSAAGSGGSSRGAAVTPVRGSAKADGSKCAGSGSSSAQKQLKRKAPDAADLSDDEEVMPNVPVIMAALPPGFVTFTAAERAAWSSRARTRLAATTAAAAAAAAAADGAGGADSSGGGVSAAAAAAAAGYPAVGALAGSDFSNPLLQPEPQQQQQQVDADHSQGSPSKRLCRPDSIKQELLVERESDTNMQLSQQQQQQQQQMQQQAGDAGSQPPPSCTLLPAAAAAAAALSPQEQQLQSLLQSMTQRLTTQQLRAFGIPTARHPDRQLPADVQQLLESRKDINSDKPLLQKSKGLGLEMLLLGAAGMASAAAAAGGGRGGRASISSRGAAIAAAEAAVKVEQGVPMEDAMDADEDAEDWAAVLAAEATLQQQQQAVAAAGVGAAHQQQQQHSSGSTARAAEVAAAAGIALPCDDAPVSVDEMLPTLHANSPAAADVDASQDFAAAAPATAGVDMPPASGLLRLSLDSSHSGQPALLGPDPEIAAAAAGDDDWEIVDVLEPGEAARRHVIDLAATAADSDSEDFDEDLSGGCGQLDCKEKLLLQQQQQQGVFGSAAAVTPVKPKGEEQQQQQRQQQQQLQQQGMPGIAAVVTPVKPKQQQQQQQLHHVPAPPPALQLAAAATAAAAAAAPISPASHQQSGKVLGRDLGYAESGGFPFWRIPTGNVYAQDNTMSPASVHVPVPGNNGINSGSGRGLAAGQQQQLPAGMSPLRPGITSSSRAAGPAAAGSSSSSSGVRPVLPGWREAPRAKSYCFKSAAWAAAGLKPVVLRQPFRQNEPELLAMLGEVRQGILSPQTRQLLASLQRPLPTDDGILPTELFPNNRLVDRKNEEAYSQLSGPELRLRCIDRCRLAEADRVGDPDPGLLPAARVTKVLDASTNAQQQLKLKPQAQVVLLWNLNVPAGLANGTRGVVEELVSVREYLQQEGLLPPDAPQRQWRQQQQQWGAPATPPPPPPAAGTLPRYSDQQPQAGVCGDPLCPCSQGCWAKQRPGLRTVRLPEAPHGISIELRESMPSWRRRQMQEALIWVNHTGTLQLPRVRFQLSPREEATNPFAAPQRLIVGPVTYSLTRRVRVPGDSEQLRLTRAALPLRLAWALTVHRSQGMSLGKLKLHLEKAFGPGMVYVALSRCTSLAGLQVVGAVKQPECDEDVRRFYSCIEAEEAWLAAAHST